jgi:hypothetical protein
MRQAARVAAGARAGLQELFGRSNGRGRDRQRTQDEDAIARFEAGA